MNNTLTVEQLLILAKKAENSVKAGRMDLKSPISISLEVINENDEDTYENRVFGGKVIEVNVLSSLYADYVHIQLEGEPNFEVYKDS